MKAILAYIALALTVACGGGGSAGAAAMPSAGRTVLFGYYGGVNSTIPEIADHASLAWVMGWNPTGGWMENTALQLAQARNRNLPSVLGIPQAYGPDAEDSVRLVFQSLSVQGLLTGIAALYPIDEPDVNGKSNAEVLAANAMLRRVMADFPALRDTKLSVIYGAGSNRPGIASYDWVGMDAYGEGCGVLAASYASLKAILRPGQRLMVVPGGADPWKQHPGCFLARAQEDPQVVAVVSFIWFDSWDDITKPDGAKGIRSNGMAPIYTEAGKRAKGA